MIKSILFILVSFLFSCAFAQNYESYYLQCNKADSLKFYGQKNEALITYKLAFQTVDFVHTEKLIKAYKLAIEISSFQDAFHFGKNIILNSGKIDLIRTKSTDFKKSNYYHLLIDSSHFYIIDYNKRINHQYIKIIDSLVFVDQYIIRNNKSYKADYNIDKSKLPDNLFELDSSNWHLLHDCIKIWGFPSEENVGYDTYNKVWAILHHNLRLKENEKYHMEIFEFVKRGDYIPEDLMVWYEQFQQQNYGQTFFTTWDGNLTTENLTRIEKNRRMNYLKGLDAYYLKKIGRYMEVKW
jgi:hypothetical protein